MKKPSEGKTESAKKVKPLNAFRIFRELTENETFYFFTSVGDYTGERATSLKDFVRKIKEVDIKTIEFHLGRGDFENWFTQTLGDKELAQETKNLQKQNLTGESLRQKLYSIVSRRYEHLERML